MHSRFQGIENHKYAKLKYIKCTIIDCKHKEKNSDFFKTHLNGFTTNWGGWAPSSA